MKSAGKTGASKRITNDNSTINPITDPKEAIDFYMPLPDDVYKKWKQK
ncbi:MAG: hypothetical protein PHX14_02455 [Syntrophomonadaceae bacterium]|nr:hypothetical protein [Syntrophomonadaceae bacterium]